MRNESDLCNGGRAERSFSGSLCLGAGVFGFTTRAVDISTSSFESSDPGEGVVSSVGNTGDVSTTGVVFTAIVLTAIGFVVANGGLSVVNVGSEIARVGEGCRGGEAIGGGDRTERSGDVRAADVTIEVGVLCIDTGTSGGVSSRNKLWLTRGESAQTSRFDEDFADTQPEAPVVVLLMLRVDAVRSVAASSRRKS